MAKNKTKTKSIYRLYPQAAGYDLYLAVPSFRKNGSGKMVLNNDLTQEEMEYIYNQGLTSVIYKTEG